MLNISNYSSKLFLVISNIANGLFVFINFSLNSINLTSPLYSGLLNNEVHSTSRVYY